MIAITKADGTNRIPAENACVSFENALHFFPKKSSGWTPRVHTCSALANTGISELWDIIVKYCDFARSSGYFETFRKEQAVVRMHNTILEYLNNSFYNCREVSSLMPVVEKQLFEGTITSYKAAITLLDIYFKKQTRQ
jgi:LAO/AO transport system kinase